MCIVDVAVDDQCEGGIQKWPRRRAEFHSEPESVSVHVPATTWPVD